MMQPERACLYIDGNNWYHFVKGCVSAPFGLSYAKLSQKLIGPREWCATRYYIGALKQDWNPRHYADQRSFLSRIQRDDPRISVHLGRLERRTQVNPLMAPLLAYLDDPASAVAPRNAAEIRALIRANASVETLKEKAVDIMLARDMLVGAIENEYDCAYLLSADGDFTPVVESIRQRGKKVFVASPAPGFSSELKRVANTFIRLDPAWFSDCYR